MTFPSEVELETLRIEGMRPTVVVCCVFQGKILIVYSRAQRSWSFVQGGIEVGETVEVALHRELQEECSTDAFIDWSKEPELVFTSQAIFRSKKSRKRTYKLGNGEERKMLGKTYFFVVVHSQTDNISLDGSEFDKFRWAHLESAQKFAAKLEPEERAQAYQEVLTLLNSQGLLSHHDKKYGTISALGR